MDVKFLGFRYENIREFQALDVSLTPKPMGARPHHVSLVQMPNGMGKTTTIRLIRLCLNGKAGNLTPAEVRSFRLLASPANKGEFELKLSVDGKVMWVGLTLDYNQGKADYYTVSVEGGGRNKGRRLPFELEQRFTENFVRLFVFDGELAQQILDSGKDEAESAITALYYLDTLSTLAADGGRIDRIVREKQESVETNVATQQGKKGFETKLQNAREMLEQLKGEKEKLASGIAELRSRITGLEARRAKIISNDEAILKKSNEAQRSVDRLGRDLTTRTETLLDDMRSPHNLPGSIRTQLTKLAESMVKLKLPRSQSVEFFKELADRPKCVCGRDIGPDHKEHILASAGDFLSEDDIGVINALKTNLKGLPEPKDLAKECNQVSDLATDLQKAIQERDYVEHLLKGADREEVLALEAERDECRVEEGKLVEDLNNLTENDFVHLEGISWDLNITLCEKRVKGLENQVAEVTKTVDFVEKSRLLKVILSQIQAEALDKFKGKVQDSTNSSIEKILQKRDVRIESISGGLKIAGREGVSVGQSLAIAYAYLSSLFHDSAHKLPFVVDSPVGSMGFPFRREVGTLIPSLFEQLVVFIISTERAGFVEYVRKTGDVQNLTICEESNGSRKIRVSSDQAFFDKFESTLEK